MAIDKVKKATFLVPRKEVQRLLNRLHSLSAVHVEDADDMLELTEESGMSKSFTSAEKADLQLKKLDIIGDTFDMFSPETQGFVEGFAAVPLQVTKAELKQVVSTFDYEPLYNRCAYIYEEYKSLQNQIEQSEAEIESLQQFRDLPFDIRHALSLEKVGVAHGTFRRDDWAAFTADDKAKEILAWEELEAEGKNARAVIVFLKEHDEQARGLLREYGFSEIALPRLPGTVDDRLNELNEDILERKEQQEQFKTETLELVKDRRRVKILTGYWLSEKKRVEAANCVASSRRISVITGWMRKKDMDHVQAVLDREFKEVSLLLEDPAGEDDVPVSLSLGWFTRPAETLVRMFGLPNYFSFDPTPYLVFSYLLFFSFCFGDVVYGLGLVAFSGIMAAKYRTHPGQRKFFRLFLYGGIGTIIFGAFTGAWAGNLYDYLGEDNWLLAIANSIPHIDPLNKPMLMLGAALGIGVVNQFYGITLNMYKLFRQNKPVDAIFDAGMWLLFLPGLMLLGAPMFMDGASQGVKYAGYILTGIGALGLILTQGRNEKGIAAKAITGVVSLYGVLGTYGVTGFISDTLSYSRLLALGFTTSILAAAFNMIGNNFKTIPAGLLVFAAFLLVGHTFNFFVSILSAFVHSARLIFLEFFNRFYEGGARAFEPLGFNSEAVELLDGPTE